MHPVMKVKKTSSKRSVTYVKENGTTVVMHKQKDPLVSVEVTIPFSEWKSDGKVLSPLESIEESMWKRIVKATKKGTAILLGPSATREAAVASVTPLRLSVLCPITSKPMKIPARGPACKHLQCFDLSCFLALQTTDGSSKCHICKAKIGKDEKLVIDGYFVRAVSAAAGTNLTDVELLKDGNYQLHPEEKPSTKTPSSQAQQQAASTLFAEPAPPSTKRHALAVKRPNAYAAHSVVPAKRACSLSVL